jgi:putative ABC transport system permease protein
MRAIGDAIIQAAAALAVHPLRAGLGALAIAVAVATMVLVVSALEGLATYARRTTARAFGAETFLLAQVAAPGRVSRRELLDQLQRNLPIRRFEVAFLERHAEDLVVYAPNVQTTAEVAAGGRVYENGAVTGTTAALSEIRDLAIQRGRFFTREEAQAAAQVAVIGVDVADAVFPGLDPLGRTIRVAGRGFTVIGTQERLGSFGGASLDRYVWIPIRAYERAFGAPRNLQVFARAREGLPSAVGEDRARISLRARRALEPGVPDNFDLLTPDAARNFVVTLSQRIGAAAGPISLMALLAAIVVVTNTVLVSVTERTREIGVRRALGAPRGQIMREVIAESSLVAIIGGLGGTALAVAAVAGLETLLEVGLAVRPSTLAWSLAASAASGLAAGWYPARRATRIDVIEALRIE